MAVERMGPKAVSTPASAEVAAQVTAGTPAELEADGPTPEQLRERLDALGVVLAAGRAEAIEWREISGIEDVWREDQEYYEGIDDHNRGETRGNRTSKPPYRPIVTDRNRTLGSTVFLNITGPYVDASAARVGDMLLPTDDRAWSIKPTPIPDMVALAKGDVPPPLARQIEAAAGGDAQAVEQQTQAVVAQAKDLMAEAKYRAERAQTQIEDWHVECQFHAHVRTVIEDTARLGSGVLKGPIPETVKRTSLVGGVLTIKEKVQPTSRPINPWNFYPEANCGESIHNGGSCWERDDITKSQLEKLIGQEGYLDSQIRQVIMEGPHKAGRTKPGRPDPTDLLPPDSSNLYEIWYYHGPVTREDFESAGFDVARGKPTGRMELDDGGDEVEEYEDFPESAPASLTMVNNRVIRIALNPLDSGALPYDMMVWKKRAGVPWGIGVARQVRTPQRMVNGAVRTLMDNAGRAAGPMLFYKPGIVEPANGIAEVRSWKVWKGVGENVDLEHLDKALRFVTIPMLQVELEAIIMLALKFAEDVTGLPMILQGQMGQNAPDTLGGMRMLNNNGTTVLRRIARLFDDKLTEPHVGRYYEFLLVYGDDEDKGDNQVDARGSSALVERELQSQAIWPLMPLSLNPAYGIDPKKTASEFLKSQRLDTKNFEFEDEEWRKLVQQIAQGPQDNMMAAAELRAKTEEFRTVMMERIKSMELTAKAQEADKQRMFEAAMAEFEAHLKGAEAAGDERMHMDDIKAAFGQLAMKLRTQRELSNQKVGQQALKPPTEPAGRARAGEAFQA